MTKKTDDTTDEGMSFRRRDLLKGVGTAGALGALGAETAGAQPPDRVIVGTIPGRADVARGKASQVHRTLDFGDIGQAVVGRWPEQALQGLRNNPHVRYVEPDTLGTRHQQTLPWGVDRVDAEIAHGEGDTGDTIDVGIIDSGIDSDHDDLEDNLGDGFALAAACSSCDEDWDDVDGHGTNVAGVVGAVDDAEDVIGVAPEVTLHALKDGDSSPQTSATAEGLEKAADEGYHVANISSSLGDTQTLNDAIDYAINNDVVIVASAGNAGPCSDCVSFPASHEDVIAVSNTNINDGLRNSSSTGPEVDLAAPGTNVQSTALNGGTTAVFGTSFSAPHVAAAAALVIADGTDPNDSGTSTDDVRDRLTDNAEDIGLSDNEQGAGLLDVANALGHDSANDLTEVETRFADDVGYTEVRLNGRLTQLTGNDSADVFFEYREVGAGTWTKTPAETQTGTGLFEATVTGLEQDTSYEFRAATTVFELDEGWSSTEYGEVEDFDTVDNPDPTASFTHDPAVPDPGDPVSFDASLSDPGEAFDVDEDDFIVSYEWDFENDGTFDGSEVTTTHSYSDPGDVTVRLRVTDEFGQTDETTETFRVNEAPEATFEWTPSVPNEGQDVEFDASDSVDPDGDVVDYEWDFGDGTTETTTAPVVDHTYDIGNYGEREVSLRVIDNDGASHDDLSVNEETIRINAVPEADFDVVTDPPVRNEPIEFDASDSADRDPEFGGEIDTYEWDFGDGTIETTTDPVVEHTFATGGEHTVTLRVTDNDGASHDVLSVYEESFTVYIRAEIVIQPNGTGPNSINPSRNGNVPVAVLHTPEFDSPATLDHGSVRFGDPDDVGFDTSTDPFTPEGGAIPAHSGGHVEDVDDDGDDDSLFHFSIPDSDFESDDTEGELVGLTNDGVPVFSTDSVNVVGGGGS